MNTKARARARSPDGGEAAVAEPVAGGPRRICCRSPAVAPRAGATRRTALQVRSDRVHACGRVQINKLVANIEELLRRLRCIELSQIQHLKMITDTLLEDLSPLCGCIDAETQGRRSRLDHHCLEPGFAVDVVEIRVKRDCGRLPRD